MEKQIKLVIGLVFLIQLAFSQITGTSNISGVYDAHLISPELGTVTAVWNSSNDKLDVKECIGFSCQIRYLPGRKVKVGSCFYTSLACPGNK